MLFFVFLNFFLFRKWILLLFLESGMGFFVVVMLIIVFLIVIIWFLGYKVEYGKEVKWKCFGVGDRELI